MEDSLEQKFVIAVREKYKSQSVEGYTRSSLYQCYVVLKEMEDELLVAKLDYFNNKSNPKFKLSAKRHSFLKEDSLISSFVRVIKKNEVVSVSEEKVDSHILYNSMQLLVAYNDIIATKEDREVFYKFIREYYKNLIKVGSVLNIIVNDEFILYFVLEKYEDSFLGLRLHYDVKSGLSFTNIQDIVSYDSEFVDINYEEGYHSKILSLLNKQ